MNKTIRGLGIGCCMAMAGLASSGCGENLISAGIKIATNQICALTATEILALNQAAIDVGAGQTPPVVVPQLTEAQAMALSTFAMLNNLCTQQQLQDLPNLIASGTPLQGLDDLAAAFGNIDPNNPQAAELAAIFASVLGGGGG